MDSRNGLNTENTKNESDVRNVELTSNIDDDSLEDVLQEATVYSDADELYSSSDDLLEEQISFELGDSNDRSVADGLHITDLSGHTADAGEELSMLNARVTEPQIEARIEAGEDLMESLGTIPEKMAFKIGEAAEMVGVKQYVLRYWESEFEMLRPKKSKNNQRVYSRKDVECAMMIKKLLYEDRFSIEGARAALKALKSQVKDEKAVRKVVKSQDTAVSTAIVKLERLVVEIRRIGGLF